MGTVFKVFLISLTILTYASLVHAQHPCKRYNNELNQLVINCDPEESLDKIPDDIDLEVEVSNNIFILIDFIFRLKFSTFNKGIPTYRFAF